MGLTARFTSQDVNKSLQKDLLRIENGLLNIFARTGEKWMTEARDGVNIQGAFPRGDYTDRSSHLRSSIAYFVLKNGQIIYGKTEGESKGISAAMDTLRDVEKSGYQLIGVAGMNYASYLENMGFNVITSQSEMAIVNITKQVNQYRDRMAGKGVDVGFEGADFTGVSMIRR